MRKYDCFRFNDADYLLVMIYICLLAGSAQLGATSGMHLVSRFEGHSGSTFGNVFSKYLAQYLSTVFIFKLQALLIVLRTLMVMSRLHCS